MNPVSWTQEARFLYKQIKLWRQNGDNLTIDESESVVNQRRLINEFINRNGNIGGRCKEFIDNGFSGTDLNRHVGIDFVKRWKMAKLKLLLLKFITISKK